MEDLEIIDGPLPLIAKVAVRSGELVLMDGSWLASLEQMEGRVAALKVTDNASQQLASDMQLRLRNAGEALEAARVELKAPFLEACREIDRSAAGPQGRIGAARDILKKAILAFDEAQRKAREEAERRRQEAIREQERLVAEEKARVEAAARKAAEEARAAAAKAEADRKAAEAANPTPADVFDPGDVFDVPEPEVPAAPPAPPQKSEAEVKLEQLKHAVAAPVAAPIGVHFRESLEVDLVDINKVPDPFVIRTADFVRIKRAFCVGWKAGEKIPECAGLKFSVKKEAITGRAPRI